MSKLPIGSVFKIVLETKTSKRFLLGTILSFSFSMAVILCTIGLMDGFELTLKKTLAAANGDIKLTSRKGFYISDSTLKESLEQKEGIDQYSSVLQIESFAITPEGSKGVLIKGVFQDEFKAITGLKFKAFKNGIVVGKVFAQKYKLKIGDIVTLALASSKSRNQGAAILEDVMISDIVHHGIYEKDMRIIYMDKRQLEEILNYKQDVTNLSIIKIKNFENINQALQVLRADSAEHFKFEPFWSEFKVLIDAVKIEKRSISMVLQLIVIVAVINIVAFIIFISEIKAQDFFMLRALGLSVNQIQNFWFLMLFFIWFVSSIVCVGLKELFSWLITNLPYLKIPGDIYVLSELKVILDPLDYGFVYGVSLIWILIIGFFIMRKIKSSSVLSGLRQEFA